MHRDRNARLFIDLQRPYNSWGVVLVDLLRGLGVYQPELFAGYKEFGLRYPEVVLAMYHRDISDIWAQVESGAADIGVTFSYTLPEELGDFEICTVASDKFCIVAPAGHPIAKRSAVSIADIRGLNYISVDSEKLDFLHRLGEHSKLSGIGGDYTVVPTIESLFLQVRAGKGLSMVPYPIAKEYGEGCSIIDIEDMDTSFDVVMLRRRDNPNPSLPLFIETMMAHTASWRRRPVMPHTFWFCTVRISRIILQRAGALPLAFSLSRPGTR